MSLTLIIAVGCNGQRSPVDSDATGGFGRSAQTFSNGTEWGEGYSMDSASTMWAYCVPEGGYPGNLAVWDEGLEVSPLITAVVRHDNYEAPSYIHLLMVDLTGEPVLEDMEFAAPSEITGYGQAFARHPAVEVTYWREEEAETGFLEVQIVWSQLSCVDEIEEWDLYYKYICYDVDDGGVDWENPSESEITKIESASSSEYDELQVDLCVDAPTGDLYAVYLRETGEGEDAIYMVSHPYSGFYYPMWQDEDVVSSSTDTPKLGPRVDAGLISLSEPPDPPIPSVMTVWSENDPQDDWQIFTNRFDIGDYPNPGATQQLTDHGEGSVSFLPQIDITPEASGYHQAVMTWMNCVEVQGEYGYPEVRVGTTPFNNGYFLPITDGGYCIGPDVACYQVDLGAQLPTEYWFGISYYCSESPQNPWEIHTRSYSFSIDWEGQHTDYESKYYYPLSYPDNSGYWTLNNPFTGTTFCLRNPEIPDEEEGPINDLFGLGWVDDDYVCKLAEGYIYEY